MATYAGDTSSSAKTNYARLGHASQDLIPKLLQQLLLFYEPTYKIRKDCLLNSYLSNKCNAIEWNNICKANTDGYVDFDVPLIYKLLRNLKLIPKPTRGWEPQGGPMITETTIGDDLERFRKSRNEILHRGNANVSDEELTEYFTQFKDIAQRLELVLNKKKNELVSEFQNLETCCMDDVSEQILANLAKKEKDESPNEKSALIKKPLQDVCCVEGEIACLSCEIIEDETAVTWYKDDAEIIPSTDIILKMHGKIRELSIPRTEMKDGGRFSIKVKQSTSEAKLTVKALISNHLVDTTCLEGSTIVLSCEVSVEGMGSIWYKDDSIVVKSNQIYPTVNSRIHQLNIFQSEIKDGGKYVFKIRDKISSAILTVKAVITKHLENVTCIEDQSLSLVCELAEKDISVIWLKDEKVIEASKNIVPEIHNNAHILKFKKLSKNDGGKYALMAEGKKTEAVVLVKAKSTIPDQILQMDENDKVMYLEIIKSGTERRYYIRLMIVGENGVGKTCLMRRLLGEDIDDVTSTDGIDVVIRKCKIRISDGQWILNEEDTVKQDRNVRMKRALTDKDSILPEEKIRDKQAESLLEDAPMETTVTPFGNVKGEEIKNVTEIKDIYTGKVMDQKNDVDMQFTNELEEESIAESVPLHTDKDVTLKSEKRVGLLDSLSDVMNVELPKEFFADCDVWDFAGQKEFYATHQTFLTNSAIYLLTADLSKDLSSQIQTKICNVDFGKVGCYIDFWFDTIHCYATTESPDQSVDKPTSDKLEPPIIIVCTGTDKIEGELSKQKDFFVKQLNSILDKQSKRKHITGIQYISNKEPLEKDFVELQSAIVQTATKMSSWGKELPLRWIHLETALDGERDAGSNILPFHLVVKLAKDSSLPTSDNEEIILFLKYQHECGHVIFFKDLPDYIILNPRWLIDAFKCFVSAHQFQGDLLYLDDWKELEETGRLTNELISRLFEKVPKLKFMEYKEHLLHVLEKFDIIVKPNNIENTTSYYLPCMIKSSSFDVICHNFGVHLPSCHRTSWLLLEFEFLPPAFFNHVLVGYIRQFNVSTESTENGRRLSLYRGIGVFDIVEKGCTKLVICADTNLIAFQIWIYDKKINSTFHDFRHTLTNMVDMLSERYQICCKYKVKLKCSESDYQKAEGRYEYCYKDDKMKSYFCPEHQSGHECLDVFKYWFSDKVDVDGLVIKEEEQGEEATQKVDMKTMKILTEVSNSIGMFVGKIQGSCWRAGTDLIVTAWHVVRYHISEYEDLNEIKLKEVKIKFDYTDSGACGDSNIFEVEPNILYCNETLDTAILRLKLNDKVVTFPPPFRRFDHFLVPAKDEHQKIYLIGHPDNLPQQVNLGVGLWNPTKERMQSLATFCKNEKYDYGYAELDKTERLVIKCEFECGASGCPGVVILDDNQVYLVTMFLKGFPDFYQSRLFNGEKKQKFPKSKLFQQGVNIGAIYDDLKKKSIYANIFEDIFIKQNPPVNMDPSAIIPSENYTDGSQDCHDRVSTSTRPTSDEGTHHVTSPCEEETNENVSTCTHPTTVERQGSQMVASANNINADTINMGGDGTNITVKNTDKKEQTNTSVGSSSSSSSENETPENFDKMEKGRHNSDCGQEPGDVDIIKEKISKMKPVSVTEQSNVTSKAKPEMLDVMRCQFRTKHIKNGVFIEDLNNIYVSDIERIAAEHGFSVENVRGDGNCMFHAIALQLLGNKLKSKIGEEKSKELRCNIVEFLKNNDTTPTGEKYSSFLSSVREDERESRWSTYLASMSKPGTYGDEIILRAVSHCFNVRIHVLSTANPERFIKYNSPDISEDSSTVYLGFIDEYLHYVRLQPKSSEGAARTALLDDNASPFKEERAKQEDERMAEATTYRHELNYTKISMLVLKICPRAVRVQFDKEFNPVHLQRTLNRNIGLLTKLKMTKRIIQPQWNLLFPRTGEPSSKDFDMLLMICLLRNLIPIGVMDRLPLATDTSVRADLSRIKYYKNIIAHCYSPMLDDTVFESYWNDVTPAILRLGGNSWKAEWDYFYGRNLDAEQEQSNPVPKNIRVYPPEFIEALSSYDETDKLADLEEKLISSFANGDSWREGTKKTSFNYLLLDPRVTKNLPSRMDSLGKVESFKVFVAAIFYVGKGERAWPLDHFKEAIMKKTKTQVSEKVKHIQDIWSDNVGVVSLQCFQNVIPVEAYTRESCMIDALNSVCVDKLAYRMRGKYYGISETWSKNEKGNMGFYFLKKALQIFKEEGERAILPVDLKGGQ